MNNFFNKFYILDKHLLPKGKPAPQDKQCGYLSVFNNIEVAKCSQVSKEYGTLCMKGEQLNYKNW